MKKLFTPLIVFPLLGGILLSSCSSMSSLSLTKRHYRSGYYVSTGKKPITIVTEATTKIKTGKQITATSSPKLETTTIVEVPAASAATNLQAYQKISSLKKKKDNYPIIAMSGAKQSAVFNKDVKSGVTGLSQSTDHAVIVVTGVPYVVIILCAIFIPPLGVGLMYGINSYFWIDLILTLLFFFPGMIFALIVVLM